MNEEPITPENWAEITPSSLIREGTTFDCTIGVTYNGWSFVLDAPKYVTEKFFGCDTYDNNFTGVPTQPGIYRCTVRVLDYDDIDDEYKFIVRSITTMKLVEDNNEEVEVNELTSLEDMLS
jgi:hypothetical protein